MEWEKVEKGKWESGGGACYKLLGISQPRKGWVVQLRPGQVQINYTLSSLSLFSFSFFFFFFLLLPDEKHSGDPTDLKILQRESSRFKGGFTNSPHADKMCHGKEYQRHVPSHPTLQKEGKCN